MPRPSTLNAVPQSRDPAEPHLPTPPQRALKNARNLSLDRLPTSTHTAGDWLLLGAWVQAYEHCSEYTAPPSFDGGLLAARSRTHFADVPLSFGPAMPRRFLHPQEFTEMMDRIRSWAGWAPSQERTSAAVLSWMRSIMMLLVEGHEPGHQFGVMLGVLSGTMSHRSQRSDRTDPVRVRSAPGRAGRPSACSWLT